MIYLLNNKILNEFYGLMVVFLNMTLCTVEICAFDFNKHFAFSIRDDFEGQRINNLKCFSAPVDLPWIIRLQK